MITPDAPNLFNALFAFHPREGYTPRENFLSEAFAHVLRTVTGACEAWVSKPVGKPTPLLTSRIFTRYAEDGVFPDLKIETKTVSGEELTIYAEHKWDSLCYEKQLQNYAIIAKKSKGTAYLVFVGARLDQVRAAKAAQTAIPCRPFLWESVYEALLPLKNRDGILDQFLDFMETHGLSPGTPITQPQMQAFLQSVGFLVACNTTQESSSLIIRGRRCLCAIVTILGLVTTGGESPWSSSFPVGHRPSQSGSCIPQTITR
jgi:hypothetical protein